jgi:hypothetical protein
MNKQDKTQSNINAAMLLGLSPREQGGGVFIDYDDGDYYDFDIFVDAELREQAVKALMERGHYIMKFGDLYCSTCYCNEQCMHATLSSWDEYEDAIAAAVNAVMG